MFKVKDRIVYDGWLKINQRIIKGKKYDILNDFNAVAAIIENEYQELLLVKQFRPALMEDTLEIPSGVLDKKDEEISECLLREVWEETQLQLSQESIKLVISYKPNVGFSNSILRMYHSKICKSDVTTGLVLGSEVKESLWLSFQELEDKIKANEIMDVKTLIAYLWIKNNRKI